jgi:hypothetical protein
MLLALIIECLKEVGFEPTDKRIDTIFYSIMWEHTMNYHNITKESIHDHIEYNFNFRRVRDSKLARKIYANKIISEIDGYLLIQDFNTKLTKKGN